MTFNLRFENERDGPNAWVLRREQVAALIRRHEPAVVGTQEGKWTQLLFLRDRLPEYVLHAPKRLVDPTCQYPTLFIRREELAIKAGGEFWLSTTPEVHRSKDWDSAFPRMLSFAKLAAGRGFGPLWVAVAHLDHVGRDARLQQARIAAEWVRSRGGPVILLGDFNDEPGSAVHRLLTAPEVGLADTWEALGRPEGPGSFTHHGFTGKPAKTRMDWILISRDLAVTDARIVTDRDRGRYPSDHFPYVAEIVPAPAGPAP